jgi:hypothetical protein
MDKVPSPIRCVRRAQLVRYAPRYRRGCWNRAIKALCFTTAIVAPSAHADALIPFMVVPWGQVVLLPLVVIVEGAILRVLLPGSWGAAMLQSLGANAASTLVGVALYVGCMFFVGNVLYSWWFMGRLGTSGLRAGLISISFAVFLYAISWKIESVVIARMRKVTLAVVSKPCAVANAVTYGILLSLAVMVGR